MEPTTRPPLLLEALRFDNRALRDLPVRHADDDSEESNALTLASGACYVLLPPSPPPLPRLALLASSAPALTSLGLDPSDAERRPQLYASSLLGGGPFLTGTTPAAHVYSGHQFGFFAGLLGDGAALYLGEAVVAGAGAGAGGLEHNGAPSNHPRRLELNLEGAGATPLTRQGRGGGGGNDGEGSNGAAALPPPPPGRKPLLHCARELLTSEALAALSIPTTRSCLLGYCPQTRCATVLRVAPSFLRVGSLEVCRGASAATGRAGPSAPLSAAAAAAPSSSSSGPQQLLPRLLDHAIRRHYPEVWRAFGGRDDDAAEEDEAQQQRRAAQEPSDPPRPPFHLSSDLETRADMAAAFLGELCAAHGRTTALWQAQGFVHGALNSDNLSLAAAATLNAGSAACFLAGRPFDRAFSPHPLDLAGGYSFGSQPGAVRFALERLAEALGSASAMTAAGIAGVGGGGGGGGAGEAAAGASAGAPAGPPPQHAPLAMPGGIGPGRARRELARFDAEYDRVYLETMRRKLGLLLVADDGGGGGGGEEAEEAAAAAEGAATGGDRALVSGLLVVMEATGADYARTMRRLSMVPMRLKRKDDAVKAEEEGDEEDDFGGFLSFLRAELPAPAQLAAAIASSLPPEPNVRALAALTRRDAAFAHALGVPKEALERLMERHRACAALRKMAEEGEEEKNRDDARRWRGWLRRYGRRLAAEAEAACVGVSNDALEEKEEAVRRASQARREAMDRGNPAFVLREEELSGAVQAAEEGRDGGAAIRRLLARVQRPFDEDDDD